MASPAISVTSFWRSQKGCYWLRWKDPRTGGRRTEKTDIDVRSPRNDKLADRLAMAKQDEFSERYARGGSTTWEEFRALYTEGRLAFTSKDNRNKWRAAAAIFDDVWPDHVIGILELADVTPKLLLATETEMRKRIAPGSLPSYAATLRAGFRWAAKMGLMPLLPPRPPDVVEYELPAMRLIPITMESLERMEAAASKVVGEAHAEGIREYLRCLWLSGCRLVDPVWMHSFRTDCHHPIILTGDRPVFGWANRQKNKRDQMARVTLDFAAWVSERSDRDWLVNPTCEHGRIESKHALSTIISKIGSKARVITEKSDTPGTATAKHFRSSFVTRWSRRGMPIEQISAMVRHGSIATTEKYYLAPPDEAMIRDFNEKDWLGDQTGDQIACSDSETS